MLYVIYNELILLCVFEYISYKWLAYIIKQHELK